MSFEQERKVLFGDCDPAGILYTPRIANYLVEASLAFLTARLGAPAERTMFDIDISLPARALKMDFLRSMTWDDIVRVGVDVAELRSRSFTLAIHGRNENDESAFEGQLTMVCISTKTRKAVSIPDRLRSVLQQDQGAFGKLN